MPGLGLKSQSGFCLFSVLKIKSCAGLFASVEGKRKKISGARLGGRRQVVLFLLCPVQYVILHTVFFSCIYHHLGLSDLTLACKLFYFTFGWPDPQFDTGKVAVLGLFC